MTKEQKYLLYRKIKAFRDSLAYAVTRVLPVKNNRIAVCTFEGKGGFGCNPRYVVEELHRRNQDYEFIWLVNDETKEFPDYVKAVKNTLWRRTYYLSTSKVWIDNYRKPYGTKKRKKQLYIQTWHGTICFKALGKWRGDGFSKIAYLVSRNDSDMIDYVVIDSEWCREAYPNGLVYDGAYLKAGSPRCDIMINKREQQRKIIREKYGVNDEAKIVMFAPTFREKGQKDKRGVYIGDTTLDFEKLLDTLAEKFGGEWILFMRLHPQLAGQLNTLPLGKAKDKVKDVSKADDMCEIMAAVDVLITDYSSAAIDASYIYMPVFLYADDIEQYVGNRGGMFWNYSLDSNEPITTNREMTPGIDAVLPFPMAQNNDELQSNILSFDRTEYENKVREMHRAVGLLNDGHASERVADLIEGKVVL